MLLVRVGKCWYINYRPLFHVNDRLMHANLQVILIIMLLMFTIILNTVIQWFIIAQLNWLYMYTYHEKVSTLLHSLLPREVREIYGRKVLFYIIIIYQTLVSASDVPSVHLTSSVHTIVWWLLYTRQSNNFTFINMRAIIVKHICIKIVDCRLNILFLSFHV